ncbi:MAG: methyltransferase domain-containing protein [Acidobacteriia bacterium]|nr:methyltransferase domain-containing protein [Terriglobia bacterium]
MPQWDADLYLKYGNQRTQPVIDLVNRIQLENPRRTADLGCGPGNSTEVLRRRWPDSLLVGVDHSPEMIAKARKSFPDGRWELGDAATWNAGEPVDLVFSNAMLHWIPNHAAVCRHLFDQVAARGALAVQVPAHYDSPLHREILEVSRDAEWVERMEGARQALTHESPAFYYDLLAPRAAHMDVWETTYHHALPGPEAVLEWFRGTGLRPFLEALESVEQRGRFDIPLPQAVLRCLPLTGRCCT